MSTVAEAARDSAEARVWEALAAVPDPEIPVLSVLDLGIVREVNVTDDVEVVVTPTYSGCPATKMIEDEIRRQLAAAGFPGARVATRLAPAWTTDWISDAGREKLRRFGIAPPGCRAGVDAHRVHIFSRSVTCPRCGSVNTERVSEFGSTACKALYRCVDCMEPFDYFKPI